MSKLSKLSMLLFAVVMLACGGDNDTNTDGNGDQGEGESEQYFQCEIGGVAFKRVLTDDLYAERKYLPESVLGSRFSFGGTSDSDSHEIDEEINIVISKTEIVEMVGSGFSYDIEIGSNSDIDIDYRRGNADGSDTNVFRSWSTRDLTGNVTITNYDPENYWLEGTFNMLVQGDNEEVIQLGNGAFKLKYIDVE